jgi:hypothetical protein
MNATSISFILFTQHNAGSAVAILATAATVKIYYHVAILRNVAALM